MVESIIRPDTASARVDQNTDNSSAPSTPASSPRSVDDISKQLEQRKKNASELAAGYSKSKQMMETISIFTFAGIFARALWKLQHVERHGETERLGAGIVLQCVVFSFLALLAADFVGGFAHWLFDTWGTVEFPLVGPTFVRSFREHHVNPSALTHHDWREANGDNCLAVLLVLIPTSLCTVSLGPTRLGSGVMSLPFYVGMLFFLFFVMYTNQIHKYAHMRPKDVPAWARAMQTRGFFMSKKHHNVHHSTFDAYYCITTGWMNYPLEFISFWRRLENLITRVTGVEPRTDDLKWTAGFGTTDGLVKETQ